MGDDDGRMMTIAGREVRVVGFDDLDAAEGMAGMDVPFNDVLGIRWDLISPDRVEAHLDLREGHLQPSGIVHGGVHCSLVEAIGSMAAVVNVVADGRFAVGVHNATDFVRTVSAGTLRAVATPIHKGNSQHLWLVEITRDDGKVAARGQLRAHIVEAGEIRR